MELVLFKKGLDYTKKRGRWVYALGALGLTSYGAYKVYHLPAVVKKRQRLLKLLGAFVTVLEMVSDSAEAAGIISKDFKEFIQSDSDQIPKSLKQISKISRSDEFSESLIRITRALTAGILQGYRYKTAKNGVDVRANSGHRKDLGDQPKYFTDQILDKFFSDAGCGFASVVVGSFAKNVVMAIFSNLQHNGWANPDISMNIDSESECAGRWVDLLCDEKCRTLIGVCVQSFVSTAVAVYLDKTMHINTCDEIFSGLTNPKHEAQVRDMLVSICNGSVEIFVRTTYNVLTSSDSKLNNSSYSPIDFEESQSIKNKALIGVHWDSDKLNGMKGLEKNRYNDWCRSSSPDFGHYNWSKKISSTLAVSKNTRFVVDLTGRVTFETVRSVLKFILEKISECLSRSVDIIQEEVVEKGVECLSRSVDIIREEVVDKGVEAFDYVNRKSSDVVTMCLSLCLHILNSPWILVPN